MSNIGIDLSFKTGAPRRIILTKRLKDDGTENKISFADAAAIANWQTQFNQYDHLDDSSDKFVPTPLIRQFTTEDVESTEWEVEDYKRIMRAGNADISFALLDPAPYILDNMSPWEDIDAAFFIITEDNKAVGIKDGSDLVPFPIKANSMSVPFYKMGGYEEGSTNTISLRLNSGADLNKIVAVTITNADVTSDTDFYSLRDATAVIANEAVTGCDFTPTLDDVDPDAPGTAIPITGIVFGEVVFRKQSDGSTVSLAGAGSISYSGGTYTVNEAALLDAATAYDLEISKSGFNVAVATVTVP